MNVSLAVIAIVYGQYIAHKIKGTLLSHTRS